LGVLIIGLVVIILLWPSGIMHNIWITGAAGFIGSHLLAEFANLGRLVCGLDYLPRPIGLDDKAVTAWQAGAIDFAGLDALAERQGAPSAVYHLAGGGSVGASFADPYQDFVSSVGGSAILLEWMRINAPAARLIYVSSAAVYGDGYSGPIAEGDAKNPYSPYGSHKFASEQLCLSAAENFGLQLSIVRPFSIYGNGLRKQLLWDSCNKLNSDPNEIILGGTGEELRDWLHVSDLCQALILAGEPHRTSPLIMNAGQGMPISVKTIIETLVSAWGFESETIIGFTGERRSGDPFSLVANADTLQQLNFKPAVELIEGITQYARWFKEQ
jgi:UDP-glucose 4-epimerase